MAKMLKLSISKNKISTLPLVSFSGEICVIDKKNDIKDALIELRKYQYIGIDTETKPAFKKGITHKVALLQLSATNKCYLIRLNKTGITDELIDFLEDDNITKIGLSLKDDISRLHCSSKFTPKGFIELQSFVKQFGIIDNSLQKIFAIIFNKKISKNQRLTNWEAEMLTNSQERYAATDAWACLEIYNELVSNKFKPENSEYLLIGTANEE